MSRSIVLFCLSIGVAASAACSSSSSNGSPADGGGPDVAVLGDSGVACGSGTCASGEVCCFARTSPGCAASAAACQGSNLACSDTAGCMGNQVCCFSFTDEAGAATGMGTFTSQCADSCNSPSYKLCASDSECSNGDTCIMPPGSYTHYCGSGTGFVFDAAAFAGYDGTIPVFPRPDAGGSNPDTGAPSQNDDSGTPTHAGSDAAPE